MIAIETTNTKARNEIAEQSKLRTNNSSETNDKHTTVTENVPDSTIEETCLNSSPFTESIPVTAKIDELRLPQSKENSKQHYCMFCKILQCKIARHFFLKHKSEKQVKMALP